MRAEEPAVQDRDNPVADLQRVASRRCGFVWTTLCRVAGEAVAIVACRRIRHYPRVGRNACRRRSASARPYRCSRMGEVHAAVGLAASSRLLARAVFPRTAPRPSARKGDGGRRPPPRQRQGPEQQMTAPSAVTRRETAPEATEAPRPTSKPHIPATTPRAAGAFRRRRRPGKLSLDFSFRSCAP